MKHELLALLPGYLSDPTMSELSVVKAGEFSAVFCRENSSFKLGKALRRHRLAMASQRQKWLEILMEAGTVMAFAPGTSLNQAEVETLVAANSATLLALAERLDKRVQYQITVNWAEEHVLAHFRTAPEIAPLFSSERVNAASVAGAVARLSERIGRSIAAQLEAISDEFAELPREAGMVSNAALLLEQGRESVLAECLEKIDAVWTDGFHIRQIGPSPAVSFATLRLQRFKPTDIARAHRTLEIACPVTKPIIRDSRQRLLRKPGAEVDEVRAAARLALAACDVADQKVDVCLVDLWSEDRAAEPGLDHVA